MDSNKNLKAKASVVYLFVAFFAFAALQELVIAPMMAPEAEVPYSQFRKDLAAGDIGEVTIEPERIVYNLKGTEGSEEAIETRKVVRIEDEDLVEELVEAGVDFEARPEKKGLLGPLLGWVLPVLPFVLIWWFLMKRMGGGPRGMMSIGKSKAT